MIPVGMVKEGTRIVACGLEGIDDDCAGTVVHDKRIGLYVWFGTKIRILEALKAGDGYFRIRLAE